MARQHDDDEADETLLIDRDAEAETVVVDREAPADPATQVEGSDAESDAETVVVERAGTAADPDRTVVVERAARPDATVAVTRERSSKATTAPPPDAAVKASRALPTSGRRRRGMTMPPVPAGFGRGAVDAVGPGAVATYEPRPLPAPPPESIDLGGVAATREESSGMPSVERRSRRTGLLALAAFAGACVVSVVGLVALGIAVLG